MTDPRVQKLAELLIRYSVRLEPGENILIENYGPKTPLVSALIREAYRAGGKPYVQLHDSELTRVLLEGTTEEHLKQMASYESTRMRDMQAYIGIRGGVNAGEMADASADKMALYQQHYSKVIHTDIRVAKTKWCVLRWPNDSMAQLANRSTEGFEGFYFEVCTLDYEKLSRAMEPLVALMEKTDRVRLVAPGTDLTFSKKNLPAVKCEGRRNIPDGEVYTAPVKDSVNGVITYNTPSVYQGVTFENIRLEFEKGRIVNATANQTARLNQILDTDEGARFVGEFSLGVNPFVLHPMKDTLFDEKIAGSLHFTPGSCYDVCNNGNKSAVHWDLVLIQRPEYGGGEVWFDDVLVRKDGLFVMPELKGLNPEAFGA